MSRGQRRLELYLRDDDFEAVRAAADRASVNVGRFAWNAVMRAARRSEAFAALSTSTNGSGPREIEARR